MQKKINHPDISKLIEACADYINFLDNKEYYSEDRLGQLEHFVFEEAMKAIYGGDVFDSYINPKIDENDEEYE